jgi:hypothetical protein
MLHGHWTVEMHSWQMPCSSGMETRLISAIANSPWPTYKSKACPNPSRERRVVRAAGGAANWWALGNVRKPRRVDSAPCLTPNSATEPIGSAGPGNTPWNGPAPDLWRCASPPPPLPLLATSCPLRPHRPRTVPPSHASTPSTRHPSHFTSAAPARCWPKHNRTLNGLFVPCLFQTSAYIHLFQACRGAQADLSARTICGSQYLSQYKSKWAPSSIDRITVSM